MCEKVCWVNLYIRDLLENRAAATEYCHNGIWKRKVTGNVQSFELAHNWAFRQQY
jgi:hypothetical protein